MNRPEIYNYSDIFLFFTDTISSLLKGGTSFRAIAKDCGINSPGYIQRLIKGERKIGPVILKKLAKGLKLDKDEFKYLNLLNELRGEISIEKFNLIYEQLVKLRRRQFVNRVEDVGFFSNWIHGVIIEMLEVKAYQSRQKIFRALAGLANQKEIEQALGYLAKKKYIIIEGDIMSKPANIEFIPYNDRQRILDIQNNHIFFLNLAKHRLSQNLLEREYQGLTMAIPQEKFPEIKKRLREFINGINEDYSGLKNSDVVYQLQLAAFKII